MTSKSDCGSTKAGRLVGLVYDIGRRSTPPQRLRDAERTLTRLGYDVDWIGDEFVLARRLAEGARWSFVYVVDLADAPVALRSGVRRLCGIYDQRVVQGGLPELERLQVSGFVSSKLFGAGSASAAFSPVSSGEPVAAASPSPTA